jgi:TP901 family phage tail tape measure protein
LVVEMLGVMQGTIRLIDQWTPTMNMVVASMHRFGQFQRQWGMNLSLFGAALTTAVTAPLVKLIKISADFESEFANVVKTVSSLNVDQFGKLNNAAEDLREQIRGLARELPFTHTALARIAAFGGQFGVATEDLAKFTETVAKLGTAVDGIETETAAKGLAQILTITGKDVGDNIERLASELVYLGNTGLSTEGTILEITRRMSGAGKTAGMSADFMMGLSAAVANLGHRSELGGTALANTVLKIDRAVSKGGESLATFAKVAKMSSKDFADAWGKDSEKTLMDLFGRLAALDPKHLSSTVAEMFGTAARHNQVILSLVNAYGMLNATVKGGERAFTASMHLQEEFSKKATTFWNQLQVVQNKLYDVALTLGGPFLNALRRNLESLEPFLKSIKAMAQAFEDASPATQDLIVKMTLLAATLPLIATGLGVLQYTFGQLFGVITGGARVFMMLMSFFTGTTGAAAGFNVALGSMNAVLVSFGSALGTAGAAIKGFISGLPGLWKLFEMASGSIWRFVDAAARLTMLEGLSGIVSAMSAAWTGFMVALASIGVLTAVVAIMSDLRDVFVHFGIVTKTVTDDATTLETFKDIINDLGKAFGDILGPLNNFVTGGGMLERMITGLIPPLQQLMILRRGIQYFAPIQDVPDPFKINPDNALTREAQGRGWSMEKSKPKDAEGYAAQTLKQFDTGFAIDAHIDKMTNDTMVNFWKQYQTGADGASLSAKELAKRQRELNKAIDEAFEKSKKFEEYMGFGDFSKFTEMNEALKKMKEMGFKPSAEFMGQFSDAAQGTLEYLKATGVAAHESLYEAARAAAQLNFELKGFQKGDLEGTVTDSNYWKEVSEELENFSKNVRAFELKINQQKWSNVIARESDETIKALFEVGKEYDALKAEFAEARPIEIAADRWQELQDEQLEGLIIKLEKVVEQMWEYKAALLAVAAVNPAFFGIFAEGLEGVDDTVKKIKKNFRETFKDSVKDMSSAFSKLANIMGDSFGGILKQVAELVALMGVGVEVGETLREVFMKPVLDSEGKQVEDEHGNKKYKFSGDALSGKDGGAAMMDSYMKLFMAAVQGFALMQSATDVAGKKNRAMRGAMTGASIGSQFGMIGGIAGFFVGAIWGAVRKLKWEEIGNRIANRLGERISEELSRSIENTAKTQFGGDMLSAEIFHMGDIIQEVGVTEKNFKSLARGIRDIFVMLEMGRFTLEQAAEALDKSFSQMLEVGTDKMGFIRKELREIVALTYEFGVQSKEVMKFMSEQGSMLLEQVGALAEMPAGYGRWQAIGEKIKEANDAIAEAAGDVDKITEANKKLTDALAEQAAAAATAKGELENLGIVIAGNIFASMADGKTLTQAILEAKDGLAAFFASYKALGIMPDDPLVKMLYTQNAIVQAIPNVVAGIGALGQSIVGLTNMNLLDAQSFGAIQNAGYNAYVAIQDQVNQVGGSTRDALLPMQDYLQRAEKAARDLGIPLDANTQMMIDQSRELGIWQALGPSATELMTSAMNTLIGKIDALIDKMFGIPDDLPNPFRNWQVPGLPPIDPGVPPTPDPSEPGRAVGSIVASGNWFENWGAGTSVKLHGQEAVIRPDQSYDFASDVMAKYAPGGMAGAGSADANQPIYLVLPDRTVLGQVFKEELTDNLTRQGITTLGRRR